MNTAPKFEFLTPIGRLVQGSVWVLNDKDQDGNPLLTQDKKPKVQCYFALAIDKNNPEFGAFWQQMVQAARAGYPQFFDAAGNCTHPNFAWKYSDGDGADNNGKSNAGKQGWAGHHILKFSSSYLPRCFAKGRYDEAQRLQDPNTVKTGFFVRVGGIMQANIGSKVPGLYLNSDMVELNFNGEEIISGRSAADTLGSAPAAGYVPPGAIALGQSVPQGGPQPGAYQPQGMPGQQPGGYPVQGMPPGGPQGMQQPPQQAYQPQGMPPGSQPPQQGYQPQQQYGGVPPGAQGMPGTPVQPNPGFSAGAMQQAGVPQGGPQPGAYQPQAMQPHGMSSGPGGFPPAQGGFPPGQPMQQQRTLVLTPAAGGYSREQFHANGINDETMVAQGYAIWQ